MNTLVPFGPADVQAVARGERPKCIMAILTSHTCGEACWHAREEVCRCSCGGVNHGCLLVDGAEQPARTSRIDGHRYRLAVVGQGAVEHAAELNRRQFQWVEKPMVDQNGGLHQYKYRWRDTDPGAPARVKWATPEQVQRWPELSAYRGLRERPALCWEIETWPEPPREPVMGLE